MRLLISLLFVLLAACGQSGDLYLPEAKPAPGLSPPPAPPAAPAAEDKKPDEELAPSTPETAPASP